MQSYKPPNKKGPEKKIQEAIVRRLTLLGWFVKETHGNMFQSGFPDLFATHTSYGARWIEVKLPDMKGSKFTAAQLRDFPKFVAHGSQIWILTGDSDTEINKLFKPGNWWTYTGIMK